MTAQVRRRRHLATESVVSGQGKEQPARPGNADPPGVTGKADQYSRRPDCRIHRHLPVRPEQLHSARELCWKQAMLAREMVTRMMADDGWKTMEMMDWDDEGREYEIGGKKVKINAKAVYAALEKSTSTDRDR